MVIERKTHQKPLVAKEAVPLYVLSDSTGNLARHMVSSFLTQFPLGSFQVHVKPFVHEPMRMKAALEMIAHRPGIVLHAVVAAELKQKIQQECARLNTPCCDLTGPAVDFLSRASHVQPAIDPQQMHPVDNAYCHRINAMGFTLEHDDGLGLDTLSEAQIVLAGVSRTGKTPTSVYLAMLGFRVANVSLAMNVALPAQLLALPPGKAVGLIIEPHQLAEIRTRRQQSWKMNTTRYNELAEVDEEIRWCRGVFNKLRCPVLDVTDQAIEETAARVLEALNLTEPSKHDQDIGLS
jgi:regulator of PEP synthase PpsR (kinase-PPPase family)